MGREYYSIPEAAALLGMSRIAVFKKVKKGQLAAIRFGRNWAVPAAAINPEPERQAEVRVKAMPAAPLRADADPNGDLDSMGWD